MTQKENRDTIAVCRERIKKTKDRVQLNLARYVRGNKKGFCKYISSTRETRESVNGTNDLVMKATETAKVFNAFFINTSCLQESQGPEKRGKIWKKEEEKEEDWVKQCLSKLDIYMSVGFDSMEP